MMKSVISSMQLIWTYQHWMFSFNPLVSPKSPSVPWIDANSPSEISKICSRKEENFDFSISSLNKSRKRKLRWEEKGLFSIKRKYTIKEDWSLIKKPFMMVFWNLGKEDLPTWPLKSFIAWGGSKSSLNNGKISRDSMKRPMSSNW